MLKLNETYWMIVDEDNEVEWDYDGPMISSNLEDGWLKNSLKWIQKSNPNRKLRITKIQLTEIL